MTAVRIKGFKIWTQKKRRKDGTVWESRPYCQHRETGLMIDLAVTPLGSPAFFAECDRISRIATAAKERQAQPGTLGGIIEHYFGREHFANLSPATQRDYRWCANYLFPIRNVAVSALDTPLISGIHDKAAKKHGWRRGNYVLTFLHQAFKHARPSGLIKHNPAEGVIPKPRPKTAGYANRPWTTDEEREMLAAASPHLRAALALMANTGLDPSDAIALRRGALADGVILGFRGKTQGEIAVPVGRRLQLALNDAPSHSAITVLASSHGRPWTYDGLSTAFHRLKTKLEKEGRVKPGLTMKGLRHTVATILRENGCDERQIADLLGQKTTSMAGHYSRSADLAVKNKMTVAAFDDAIERRATVVKPFPKTVKP